MDRFRTRRVSGRIFWRGRRGVVFHLHLRRRRAFIGCARRLRFEVRNVESIQATQLDSHVFID
jgi:hypothetical protein